MTTKFLLAVFLFIISNSIAQNKMELTLHDGSVLKGFGRIKLDERILFRTLKDADKEFYDYTTVKKLTMSIDG
ncbi:hypothetical protein LX77_00467 [Gelidibacter algens]|uniref:Uncharacterized protein n=1 Tax=Gelidibacter algens TaxID=49280 RepID=A0A327SJY6_9FLAO|nr:hypothetical protein [Gelidibacter algens]RAJ27893.1 hypothetical protein LX77_00467 [Gelidibacter algens]